MGAGRGDKPVAMWTQDAYQYVKLQQQCTGWWPPTLARDEAAADAGPHALAAAKPTPLASVQESHCVA
jgi:hypothetical protein